MRNKMLRLFRKRQGFSLIELLVVVAILGVLASVAIPSYTKYKKNSYDTWIKTELAESGKFLLLARSVDNGYHQYLGATGYRPSSPLLGNVGFYHGYAGQNPCCLIYPSNITVFPGKNYISRSGFYQANAFHICEHNAGGTCSEQKGNIKLEKSFSNNGIGGLGNCSAYSKQETYCNCDQFILVGVTGYGKEFSSHTSASAVVNNHGGGVLVMDQNGLLCKADADDSNNLKKY